VGVADIEAALVEASRNGDKEVVIRLAHYLALCAESVGDFDRAKELLEEAMRAARARARRLGRRRSAFLHRPEIQAVHEDFQRYQRQLPLESGV
jgi:hypothetical protein